MSGQPRQPTTASIGTVVVAVLVLLLAALPARPANAEPWCTLSEQIEATSCPLLDGKTVEGRLGETPTSTATYRLDVVGSDATLDLLLQAKGGSTHVAVLDWQGTVLGQAVRGDMAPDVRLSVKLALPGVYAVRVRGDLPPDSPTFQLTSTLTYPNAAGQPYWPPALLSGDSPRTGERYVARTPRGGTPTGAVAVARALRPPPDGNVGDFTLVTDVRFEQVVGPGALTVRFRYEPEAGGGTGYVLTLDPFSATVILDSFEEGQREAVTGHLPMPFAPTPDRASRLVLRASGPHIAVTLDGQMILEADDGRYPRGLIALGAVTWADPVAVTFDHIQVTTPPPPAP
jgi:hypothetical protein